MRTRWAIPLSIALLLLSALGSHQATFSAANHIGVMTYEVRLSGLPLPYLRTFTSQGGEPEYTEVLTAQLAVDESFWLLASFLMLCAARRGRSLGRGGCSL